MMAGIAELIDALAEDQSWWYLEVNGFKSRDIDATMVSSRFPSSNEACGEFSTLMEDLLTRTTMVRSIKLVHTMARSVTTDRNSDNGFLWIITVCPGLANYGKGLMAMMTSDEFNEFHHNLKERICVNGQI